MDLEMFDDTHSVVEKFDHFSAKYGFANKYSNVLNVNEYSWKGAIDIDDLALDLKSRTALREEKERIAFDIDHYLADYFFVPHVMQPFILQRILEYVPNYNTENELTSVDLELLRSVTACESFNLETQEKQRVMLSAIDILLAYCYEMRTSFGESGSETAWTINKLCATFSWLQVYDSAEEVMTTFARRSLCYPLYRHWLIGQKVLQDVTTICSMGKERMLKCFLAIYCLFEEDSSRHILNDLYLRDYLIWIRTLDESDMAELSELVAKMFNVTKRELRFNLVEIEKAAMVELREDNAQAYQKWLQDLRKISPFEMDLSSTSEESSWTDYSSSDEESIDQVNDELEKLKINTDESVEHIASIDV